MGKIIYGRGGYRPAHPSQGKVEEHDDATSTVTRWNDDGTLRDTRAYTATETARAVAEAEERVKMDNRSTLEQRATQALAANATFLAIASPTNAQTLAQVQRLTKECTAIIRLILNKLDSTDGTE